MEDGGLWRMEDDGGWSVRVRAVEHNNPCQLISDDDGHDYRQRRTQGTLVPQYLCRSTYDTEYLWSYIQNDTYDSNRPEMLGHNKLVRADNRINRRNGMRRERKKGVQAPPEPPPLAIYTILIDSRLF